MAGRTLTREESLAANILPNRPAPKRDHARESHALDALIGRINGEPGGALQALVETAVALTGAGSAGVSILTDKRFVWPAIAGNWAKYAGNGLPIDASPCQIVIERNAALLFDRPDRLFPEAAGDPRIEEVLLVPLSDGGAPIGTLWVLSHDDYRFNSEDARILQR
jgi:GAF domain-containing protein